MSLAGFPDHFLWGAATAAYQIEGAVHEDGRGESIWDRFAATPGKVRHGDTGEIACDHYHRYGDDVALIKELGLKAYRFSIAWPRILPQGVGHANAAGLDFYDRLVDELLAAGVRPFATLYHWDMPQVLQDQFGGWSGRESVEAFVQLTDVVTRRLGDRVHDWITLNEPLCAATLGYGNGLHAPGLQNQDLMFRATHHLLLAHGRAVPVIRANSPQARVGITLNLSPMHPASADPADVAAARYVDGLNNRLYLDPVFKGTYPQDVLAHIGPRALPVEAGDLETIAAPIDLLGINYYNRSVRRADPTGKHPEGTQVEIEHAARTAMGWEVYPEGIYELLTRVHDEYGPRSLYITESGCAYDDVLAQDGRVHDPARIAYLDSHFEQARRAIAAGVPLDGYFVWSLLDNFEWAEGFSKRFGIVYVDFATQQRVVKDSGQWYAELIGRGVPALP